MADDRSESHRFLLTLLIGLVLLADVFVLTLREEPVQREIQVVADDSPILVHQEEATTTTVAPSTTVAAPPATVAKAARSASGGGSPTGVPRNPYAAEPVQEIGTIEIPKIGLVHKVMHGITLRNIDHGPSHWPGTAFPGENGNAVFAGHRVTHSKPFRNIDQLVSGDLVHFTINGVRSTYVVTGSEVVSPKALYIVDQTPTPTATIFACHPPGSARQRYVVRMALAADPAAPAPAEQPAA